MFGFNVFFLRIFLPIGFFCPFFRVSGGGRKTPDFDYSDHYLFEHSYVSIMEYSDERSITQGHGKDVAALYYKIKTKPLMISENDAQYHSSRKGDFYFTHSIAIDPETDYVYVCDWTNDRIQVFNEYLQLVFSFYEEVHCPVGIGVSLGRVYLTQNKFPSLTAHSTEGRFIQSVGKIHGGEFNRFYPRGIAVSQIHERVYTCDYWNDRVLCLNLDLEFESSIDDINYPKDINLSERNIFILIGSIHCIRIYDYSHQLYRVFFPRVTGYRVENCWHFCLDKSFNIILTDSPANCVHIFSMRGELLHKFGKKGRDTGEFIGPRGIVVDSRGRILVSSLNTQNSIQMF